MAGLGHEDLFLPHRLNARSRFGYLTFTGVHGNGRDAPITDRGGLKRGRQQSTHERHSPSCQIEPVCNEAARSSCLMAPVSMVKAAGGIASSEAVNWCRNSLSRSTERSFPNATRS
jgi:hypothetical protein